MQSVRVVSQSLLPQYCGGEQEQLDGQVLVVRFQSWDELFQVQRQSPWQGPGVVVVDDVVVVAT